MLTNTNFETSMRCFDYTNGIFLIVQRKRYVAIFIGNSFCYNYT